MLKNSVLYFKNQIISWVGLKTLNTKKIHSFNIIFLFLPFFFLKANSE